MTKDDNNAVFSSTLDQLEELLDECDANIDYDTVSDILTIEFENSSKIIINYQSANGQLWLAAPSGGYHYNYDDANSCWKNDRSGTEFFDELSALASEQSGEKIVLKRE